MAVATRRALFTVLAKAARVLQEDDILFVVGGGLAAEAYRLRETVNDVDLFVRPIDAPRARRALESHGFRVWIEDPRWLYKASADGVLVDIIYESTGIVHVGDETFRRARRLRIDDLSVPVMPPEDLFVMKAAAATPSAPKHWLDAISLLETQPMDWDYLAERAAGNPKKVLRAIMHAYDDGVPVPSFVFVRLARDLTR